MKWVFFYILISSILFDSLGNLLPIFKIKSVVTINLFVLVEGVLLHYFFYLLFFYNKKFKQTILASLCILLFIWIYNNILLQKIQKVDNFSNGFESIIVIFFCLIYFYNKIKKIEIQPITSKFEFWLVTATFIYFSITFFIFLIPLDRNKNPNDYHVVMLISRIGNIIYSFLLTIAFMIDSTKKDYSINKKSSIYNITDY